MDAFGNLFTILEMESLSWYYAHFFFLIVDFTDIPIIHILMNVDMEAFVITLTLTPANQYWCGRHLWWLDTSFLIHAVCQIHVHWNSAHISGRKGAKFLLPLKNNIKLFSYLILKPHPAANLGEMWRERGLEGEGNPSNAHVINDLA